MRGLVEAGAVAGQGRGRWGDLRLRTLSAAVLAPAVLLCIWFGGPAWTVLMAVTGVGLGLEWAALCGCSVKRLPGLAVPVAIGAAGALASWRWGVPALAACVLIAVLAGRRWLALGVVYVGVAFIALASLRVGASGRVDLLFLVLTVWACDIGAYAVGRLVGGPKLAPWISPGKTWSGAAGGLAAAVSAGLSVVEWLAPVGASAVWRVMAVALLLGVASQAGDLLESWMKRRFGVKDSGRSIPGHGGLLDRLDGMLAAAPVAAAIAAMTGRGGALWN